METILCNKSVSVTELKRNFADVLAEADNSPVAVLNHNRPEAYLLSAAHYEQLLNRLEDFEDARLTTARANGPFVEVEFDAL